MDFRSVFASLLGCSPEHGRPGQGPPPVAQQSFAPSLIVQPLDETKLTVLKGNTHPLARMQYDRGAAPPALPLNRMLLVLRRSEKQEAALRKLLDAQQDKSSASYHKWFTPEEFGKQFGPSDQDIQSVTTWLQEHGLQLTQVAKGRGVIEFSGTAAQVEDAFHTEIHNYVVNGESHWANATDPAIPAALTALVSGVDSLNNFQKKSFQPFCRYVFKVDGYGKIGCRGPAIHLSPEDAPLMQTAMRSFLTTLRPSTMFCHCGMPGSMVPGKPLPS